MAKIQNDHRIDADTKARLEAAVQVLINATISYHVSDYDHRLYADLVAAQEAFNAEAKNAAYEIKTR